MSENKKEENLEGTNQYPPCRRFAPQLQNRPVVHDDVVNGDLTEDIFYPDGRTIDPMVILENYAIENNSTRILLDDDLFTLMTHCKHPLSPSEETKSPFVFNYCSYLWTHVLKTQFEKNTKTSDYYDFIRATFIDDMLEYQKADLDNHTIFVQLVHENGLSHINNDIAIHVPAILRVLTPSNEIIAAAANDTRILFMTSTLRNLSPETLLKPWKFYLEHKYEFYGCKTKEEVS